MQLLKHEFSKLISIDCSNENCVVLIAKNIFNFKGFPHLRFVITKSSKVTIFEAINKMYVQYLHNYKLGQTQNIWKK